MSEVTTSPLENQRQLTLAPYAIERNQLAARIVHPIAERDVSTLCYWGARLVAVLDGFANTTELVAEWRAFLVQLPHGAAHPAWYLRRAAERDVLADTWLPAPSVLLALPDYVPPVPLTSEQARAQAVAKLAERASMCSPPQSLGAFLAGLAHNRLDELSTPDGWIAYEARAIERRHEDDRQAIEAYQDACFGLRPAEVRAIKATASGEVSRGFLRARFRPLQAVAIVPEDRVTMPDALAEIDAHGAKLIAARQPAPGQLAAPTYAQAEAGVAGLPSASREQPAVPPVLPAVAPSLRPQVTADVLEAQKPAKALGRRRNRSAVGRAELLSILNELESYFGSQRALATGLNVDEKLVRLWRSGQRSPNAHQAEHADKVLRRERKRSARRRRGAPKAA